MAINPLPVLDRTSATFKTDVDTFFGTQLPAFSSEANATAAAMNLNSTNDTSATSQLIATGAKTFTVSSGKSFQKGMYLVIADTAAAATNSMYGQIDSYTTTSLVMNIISVRGSGTKTAWTISQSASGFGSAADIANTPAGGIGSTTVQGALNELDLEKANIADVQAQTYIAATTAGTLTAYTLTPAPAIAAYAANQAFFVNFHVASGASPTLQINGIATPPQLVKQSISGTYGNIAAGDIPAGHRSYVILISATQALVVDLPVPAGGPAFSAYQSATQTVSSGVFTKVSVNTEYFDTNNNFDSVTNFRFTPTVAGYYQISGGIRGSVTTGAALITATIYKNGAEYARGAEMNTSASTSTFGATVSELVFFNGSTDYVELYGYVAGTSPQFIFVTAPNTGRFSGVFVRGA